MDAGIKPSQGKLQLGAKTPSVLRHPVDVIFYTVILPALQAHMSGLFERLNFPPHTEEAFEQFIERTINRDPTIDAEATLAALQKEINNIYSSWNYGMTSNDSSRRAETIEKCFKRFMTYAPYTTGTGEIEAWSRTRLPGGPSTWLLIKTAKLYMIMHKKSRTNMMFHLAGRQLGYLRAMVSFSNILSKDLLCATSK